MSSWLHDLREVDQAFAEVAPDPEVGRRIRAAVLARTRRSSLFRRSRFGLALAVAAGVVVVVAISHRSTIELTTEPLAVSPPVDETHDGPRSRASLPSAEPLRGIDTPAPSPRRRGLSEVERELDPPADRDEDGSIQERAHREDDPSAPSFDVREDDSPRFEWNSPDRRSRTIESDRADGFRAPLAFRDPTARDPWSVAARSRSRSDERSSTDHPSGPRPEAPTDLPDPNDTEPAPSCSTSAIDPGGCIDMGELKSAASEDLCGDGESLVAFDIDVGECGDGLAESVKYTCCPAEPPPDPGKKPSGSGGETCSTEVLEADACTDESALTGMIKEKCLPGTVLTDFKFDGECPSGEATSIWFNCCPVSNLTDG